MAKGPNYVVGYRRKRKGKTNYKKRLDLLKSGRSRIVIRKSNKHATVQIVDYKNDGDVVIASSHSSELEKFGWSHGSGNIPASHLTGLLCGLRAKTKGVKKAILDMGLNPSVKGSRIYSALGGIQEGGIEIPMDEEIAPTKERVEGKHISDYKKDDRITKEFKQVKEKIMKSLSKS